MSSWAKYFVLVMLFLYTTSCMGQKDTYYENIFKKEFSALKKEHSDLKTALPNENHENIAVRLFTSPQILPDWFLYPPAKDTSLFYAIGISDPWMDPQKGRKQAMTRAQSIACMMRGLHTKGVIETYNHNQDNKFQQISQFVAMPPTDIDCEPADSFQTKYQEQIYLVKCMPIPLNRENSTAIEYFISSDSQEEKYNQLEKLRLKSNTNNVKSEYESLEINRNQQVKSVLDSDSVQIIPATYRYTLKDSVKAEGKDPAVCLLTNGLWQGYLKSLVHSLDISASDLSPKVKSLSDNKESDEPKNSLQHLIRTIYNVSFSFTITEVRLEDRGVELQLKLENN